jgi:hypothetical protein
VLLQVCSLLLIRLLLFALLLLLLLLLLHLQLLLPLPVLLQLLLQLALLVVLHCQHAPCCQWAHMLLLLLPVFLLLLWHHSAHKHLTRCGFPSLTAEQPGPVSCKQRMPRCAAVAAAGAAREGWCCFNTCFDALEHKLRGFGGLLGAVWCCNKPAV